jgi:phosphohistidine phosphatase
MRLYLLQHGEAVAKDVDTDWPLNATGRHDMEALAERVAAAGLGVSCLAHSGKTRVRQSAETIAAAIRPASEPEVRQGLAPKDSVAPLLTELAAREGDMMVVGHQPFMGRLVGALLDCALSGTGFETPSRTFTGSVGRLVRNVPDGANAPSGQASLCRQCQERGEETLLWSKL